MSEPRQLPGPYIADHGDGESFARATSGTPLYVARFEGPDHVANCDLFVAAPEMYELLEQLFVYLGSPSDSTSMKLSTEIIDMLIKAEGCK